ncbi:MAG: hypothetical protein K2X02_06295 [Alphaproteobacteria bacterium]|nr:hypothetical protein [Alphaproteobacteria bacterium]
MLRFSIMTGMILSTLNPHSLKAFNDDNNSSDRRSIIAVSSSSVDDAQQVSNPERPLTGMERSIYELEQKGITIPPEGQPAYLPDGTWVCTLYPEGYTLNMAIFDRSGEWRKEQERKQQYALFLEKNEFLIEKLDKISGERAFNCENSPSTNYIWRAIIDGQPFANLEIGFFALKHREDSRVLMEVFKGITPEERKKLFGMLCFQFSPKFENFTTQMIGEEEHRRLKSLEEEIMKLPYDSSKTDLLAILNSLKIKSLFEKEDSQPASSSQE